MLLSRAIVWYQVMVSNMAHRTQRRDGNPISHEPAALSSDLELPDTPV